MNERVTLETFETMSELAHVSGLIVVMFEGSDGNLKVGAVGELPSEDQWEIPPVDVDLLNQADQ